MKRLMVAGSLGLMTLACGGDSPSGPSAPPLPAATATPAPTPLYEAAGTGDTVFDIPVSVKRIKITGTYNARGSNFIVWIAGRLIVNEIIGTGYESTRHEGTYLINGGVVEIKSSSGVAWTFTEVR